MDKVKVRIVTGGLLETHLNGEKYFYRGIFGQRKHFALLPDKIEQKKTTQ